MLRGPTVLPKTPRAPVPEKQLSSNRKRRGGGGRVAGSASASGRCSTGRTRSRSQTPRATQSLTAAAPSSDASHLRRRHCCSAATSRSSSSKPGRRPQPQARDASVPVPVVPWTTIGTGCCQCQWGEEGEGPTQQPKYWPNDWRPIPPFRTEQSPPPQQQQQVEVVLYGSGGGAAAAAGLSHSNSTAALTAALAAGGYKAEAVQRRQAERRARGQAAEKLAAALRAASVPFLAENALATAAAQIKAAEATSRGVMALQ